MASDPESVCVVKLHLHLGFLKYQRQPRFFYHTPMHQATALAWESEIVTPRAPCVIVAGIPLQFLIQSPPLGLWGGLHKKETIPDLRTCARTAVVVAFRSIMCALLDGPAGQSCAAPWVLE